MKCPKEAIVELPDEIIVAGSGKTITKEELIMKKKDGLIRMALDELGVPNKDYPAPVSNAVAFLNEALKERDIEIEPENN